MNTSGEETRREKVVMAVRKAGHAALPLLFFLMIATKVAFGASTLGVNSELDQIKVILSQVGPALSAVLFIVAGVFYALGQVLPPEKKAQFHTTAVNIIIGAIVVGVLSVASTSLATASTGLLSNFTTNSPG